MEKQRHACKLCNKAFRSSRGLGGHMKSHGGAKRSAAKEEKRVKTGKVDFEGDGYGLRVNPRKSWKFSSSKFGALCGEGEGDENVRNCKVCGKRFGSVRAMLGHMRHHWKNCKDCGKGFDSLRALATHSRKRLREFDEDESECILGETMGVIRRKRSKRLRYKFSTQSCCFDSVNESRYVSEFGQEVVEGAICLMIISGGGGARGQISSVTEFSDNNSFSLEVQSPGLKNKVGISACDDIGSIKINLVKVQKLVDCLADCKNEFNEKKMCEFSENDSGFASDEEEEKTAKFKVPINKFCRGTEFERAEVDEESAFVLNNAEIEKESHGIVEMDLGIVDEVEFSVKSCLNKKPKACESGNNMIMTTASEVFADSQKKREHRCRTCGKVFGSHQAVGGHQRVHSKAFKACSVVKIEDSEDKIQMNKLPKIDYSCKLAELEYGDNSMEQEMQGATLIGCEAKGYICNICLKVFATGQALGGHKRLHYGKESEASTEQTMVLKQQISEICDAFDLTRPVRPQEENGGVEYKSWLFGTEVRSDCIHGSFQVSSSGIC